MRILIFALALGLAGCGTTMMAPPVSHQLPLHGQIVYQCDNGSQIAVDLTGNSAQVAIVGGPSMVLPNAGDAYSNGRYTFRGGGESASWQTPGQAPVACRGS